MQKHFYLFRHGQTDMNLARRWQGSGIDTDLNPAGMRQAQGLANSLIGLKIEAVYTSPLARAVQTAQIVAGTLRIPVFEEQRLVEGCFGVAEGKTLQEIYARYPDVAPLWEGLEENSMDVCFKGGETKRQIQQRILTVLTEIAQKAPYSRIGISGHSSMMRCTLLAFGKKLGQIPHGSPFHLVWNGEQFSLAA